MNGKGNREESLFNEAMALPTPEARAAFLREACAGDDQLRQRVEALMAAAQPTNDFLEQAAPGARAFLSASPGAAGSPSPPPEERAGERRPPTPTPQPTISLTVPIAEKPGDRIGHYKLLEQIGEGGCGVVYMAEQTEPIRRRVAFKVIKLGMDTRQVIARFEAERQALALMDHPNIAKVLDAGTTDTGRPYFVMELVRGIRITDYCDQHKLSTAERLRLFVQVCRAIQHAHYKGIIHRDIKPSNVLVTEVDGLPSPKVIDFGIAKAIGPRLTDKTLFTQFEQLLGTPAYASPEQVGLGGMDVDARSDIYSLGVLLYELLTGRTPFETKELLQAGLEAFLRVIRETEPPKPAVRLTTLSKDELSEVAARRQATPDKLNRLVRGEMDWMVMKALEKDRRRRYESAAAFAEDLERWVEGKPILARPIGVRERVVKWARRKPALAALVGVCMAAAVLVLAVFAVGSVRIRAALHRERVSAYASGIRLAEQELSAGDLDRAKLVLDNDCQPYLRRWEWHYLKHQAEPELLAVPIWSGWESPSMAFSPDGKHLAVPGSIPAKERAAVRSGPKSSPSYRIRIVDARTGEEVVVRSGPKPSPSYRIRIVNVRTGEEVRTLGDSENTITGLAYSPDGRCIAARAQEMVNVGGGSWRPLDGWKVWDVNTRQQLFEETHASSVDYDRLRSRSVVFSPDSQRIASVNTEPPELVVSELSGERVIFSANHGISGRLRVVWSPDGRHLATYQKWPHYSKQLGKETVGPVRVWDASDGKLVFERTQGGHACDFSRDGRWLYISSGSELHAWDLATGKEVPTFTEVGSGGGELAVSPDGTALACGLNPGGDNIVVRDARTGSRRYLLREVGSVMAFSPDGGRLATLKPAVTPEGRYQQSKTSTCSIWDVKTGELLKVLHGAGINLEFHPDGTRLATATPGYLSQGQSQEQANGVVRILSVEGPSATFEFPLAFSYPIAFSPAGGNLAVCEHTNDTAMIAVFEAQTGRRVNSIGPILRDSEHVRVYREKRREVDRVTDTADVLQLSRYVCDIAFSPDGQVLATAADHIEGTDNGWKGPIAANDSGTARHCEVKLWDVQTGRELAAIRRPPPTDISNLAFSPDGRRLAFGMSREHSGLTFTEIYDVTSGAYLFKLDGKAPVYSPDGRLLATTCGLWDSKTGEPVCKPGRWFDPGGAGVPGEPALAFDPASRRLAATSGRNDGMIKLFGVPSGKLLQVLQSDLGRLESISFTPDGERLISCSPEGPVRIWDARAGRCLLTLSSSFASLKDLQDLQNDPLRKAVLITERSLASLQDRQRALAPVQKRQSQNVLAVSPFYSHAKAAVSADGTCIATTDERGRVRLWRAAPAKTK